jgi:hypothetical protein
MKKKIDLLLSLLRARNIHLLSDEADGDFDAADFVNCLKAFFVAFQGTLPFSNAKR